MKTPRALLALAAACLSLDAEAAPAWLPDVPSEWTMIQPGPVEVGGTVFQATCSGLPGTDPAFHFWAKRGSVDAVVVFFEGGGACWDDLTCTFPIAAGLPQGVPQFYKPAILPTDDPRTYSGIFELSNPQNPVRDWTFVYIPYCTGDVHLGSATSEYHNAGNPVLPLPAAFPIQHRGFDNFMVVLDWMRRHVHDPNRILVTGSSAGAYGAAGNFPWIAEAYPRAHLFVLADAGQGVTTVAWDYGNPGRESWNVTLPPTVVGSGEPTPRTWEILRDAALRYPHAKVSQFTTRLDGVQIAFYSVMKQLYGPGGACPSPAVDWNQQMVGALGAYGDTDNYRFYLAEGTYHTIMRAPWFYTESSAGLPFKEWLAGMLRSRGGTGGRGGLPWSNAACPDCLVPAPCGP
ncbi:MAG TPA: pectin acetylesterase-family hydrolase [Anaeromyxobacteraceae bacterium]|nr:pectin acetylesterase-family hydrolase [Anaeromyxobacteraceae bacterium]